MSRGHLGTRLRALLGKAGQPVPWGLNIIYSSPALGLGLTGNRWGHQLHDVRPEVDLLVALENQPLPSAVMGHVRLLSSWPVLR